MSDTPDWYEGGNDPYAKRLEAKLIQRERDLEEARELLKEKLENKKGNK
jgi:hypothetical protein